jgi:glyoxylase-like metal-dependent hydrolase (beta-lactamase superfamily II)
VDEMSYHQSWFDVKEVLPDIFLISEPGHAEWINSYLIRDQPPVLIDSGMGIGHITTVLQPLLSKEDLAEVLVICTHSHYDHVGGNHLFRHIAIHPSEQEQLTSPHPRAFIEWVVDPSNFSRDPPPEFDPKTYDIFPSPATQLLEDGDSIALADRTLEIVHAPGHSPGSICIFDSLTKAFFAGDVIYGGPLYAHLPGSDVPTYSQTTKKLRRLWQPKIQTILPAHNEVPLVPEMIEWVDAAFEQILTGNTAFQVENEVRRYSFGSFSILIRNQK